MSSGSNFLIKADAISLYMSEVNRFPLLTKEEEMDLALKYAEDADPDAAEKMVTSNLRFVVKIANEYKRYGLNLVDLIQEGNIGLMMAVKKFDPSKGFRLISYAVWWIRAYIHNYIIRSWSLVKIGTTAAQKKLFYKLRSTQNQLSSPGNEGLLDEESAETIAKMLDIPKKEVESMDRRLQGRDLSLNTEVESGSGTSFIDLIESKDNPVQVLATRELDSNVSKEVSEIIKDLNEREQMILTERLMSDDEMTLQEIGDHFGISRERARQIENRLKEKIKERLSPKVLDLTDQN